MSPGCFHQHAPRGHDVAALVAKRIRIDDDVMLRTAGEDQPILAAGHGVAAERARARRHVSGHETPGLVAQRPACGALVGSQPIEITTEKCSRGRVAVDDAPFTIEHQNRGAPALDERLEHAIDNGRHRARECKAPARQDWSRSGALTDGHPGGPFAN
jgi:hypothetical protein